MAAAMLSRAALSRTAQRSTQARLPLIARRTIVNVTELKYSAAATASGPGRQGKTELDDGSLSFQVRINGLISTQLHSWLNPKSLVVLETVAPIRSSSQQWDSPHVGSAHSSWSPDRTS